MTNESSVRRILPQHPQPSQVSNMTSFQFAHQQFPQRETQKNFVFVDEHNRHKRLKVMRACEGCRRRKIKCDAATTNTWPCSACIRLKLSCVRPNGYDGSADSTYDPSLDVSDPFQQMQMHHQIQDGSDPNAGLYPNAGAYLNDMPASYRTLPYEGAGNQNNMHYAAVGPHGSLSEQSYATTQQMFPTPPHQGSRIEESSPEAYSPESYQQHDLADLLGGLKVDNTGTAPYLRNKSSFRREEAPTVEDDDDYESALPSITMTPGRGMKIRIPPPLMPDEESANRYFDLYFAQVHPFVPVLDQNQFYRQWRTNPSSISPLILEAIFAIGGRLAEDPGDGQQWLALASRHADFFMDVPRLSTVQALLMILKAREAAPKRGYYYRSWMTVVACVQMGKDLGLHEHLEDHEAGQSCEFTPTECRLRTRIWQTIFVCEVMVGTPQGRHDLAIAPDTVHTEPPQLTAGMDETEYNTTRNFTYLAQIVKNVRKMSKVYLKLRKKRDWGSDQLFQQLQANFDTFLENLPLDLNITLPPDGSTPWLPSAFVANMHSYHWLIQVLFHRPILSALDPNGSDGQWKQHMMICYSAAKNLCRLQEAIIDTFGLNGLQSMQRGFSFTVYAGLSCIVLHLVAIVSPDTDMNSDAREFFTRHMRIMEQVMEVWNMPELQGQIDAVREAFSADTRKPFALKPSFPYGSPHQSNAASPPRSASDYRSASRAGLLDHQLDPQTAPHVSQIRHPLSPPGSVSAMDSKGDHFPQQTLGMMPPVSQGPVMHHGVTPSEAPAWNPSRIFEQWHVSFGTPSQSEPESPGASLNLPSSVVPPDQPTMQDMQAAMQAGVHQPPPLQQAQHAQQFSAAAVPNFITPAMWQESVASVYEGGLKRSWDYDGRQMMKRR